MREDKALPKPASSSPKARGSLQPLVEATPLKRGAEPEEVGWCALFLASDETSFVTGSELVVDGGYTAQHDIGVWYYWRQESIDRKGPNK